MNLVPDFKNTLFNDNVKDIALDFSEIGIDAAINNDILAEVPIAKSIVGILQNKEWLLGTEICSSKL